MHQYALKNICVRFNLFMLLLTEGDGRELYLAFSVYCGVIVFEYCFLLNFIDLFTM